MPRCFILNRVSTDKQRDNLSITVQRQLHPRIADQLGCAYTPDDVFDLDVSSTTYDRRKWNAVKTAIASGRYAGGYGIFGDISRYHRDKDEWFEFLTHCLRQRITVAIPDTERTTFAAGERIPVRTYDADDFKDLIQLVFEIEESQNFKRKFRKKVLMAFSSARDAGINIFGTGSTPYGYRWKRDGVRIGQRTFGVFVPDPDERTVVELIFTMDVAAPNMARWLNERGHKTRHRKMWDATAVYRVRRKLIYCGKMKNTRGDVIDAVNVEPIITYKQFVRAQHITRSTIHVGKPLRVKFALSGMSWCGLCHDAGIENKMVRQTFDRTRIETSRLYCAKRKFNAGASPACRLSGRGFQMVKVLRAVNADLAEKIGDERFITRTLADYKRKVLKGSNAADVAAVRNNMAAVERKIKNLTDAVADGFDRSVAINQLNALKIERDELNNRLAALELPVKRSAAIPTAADVRELYRQFLHLGDRLGDELLVRIHAAFIDRLYIYPDRVVVVYRYFPDASITLPDGTMAARKIDVPRLIREYGRRSTKELAAEFGVSTNAVRFHLHKNGITPRRPSKIDPAVLSRMYRTHTVPQLARHFKCSTRTIFAHLARMK